MNEKQRTRFFAQLNKKPPEEVPYHPKNLEKAAKETGSDFLEFLYMFYQHGEPTIFQFTAPPNVIQHLKTVIDMNNKKYGPELSPKIRWSRLVSGIFYNHTDFIDGHYRVRNDNEVNPKTGFYMQAHAFASLHSLNLAMMANKGFNDLPFKER